MSDKTEIVKPIAKVKKQKPSILRLRKFIEIRFMK